MKRVREIIRRMEQGATEAVLCRADDGMQYVVKTHRSGCEALVKEWLCAAIGQRLELPIPPVELVYMDSAAARYSVYPEAAALVDCAGFASELIEPADIMMPTIVGEVPALLRANVLLFDWWILNQDRQDSNPNLLWLPHSRQLHVIDHNLAFGGDQPPIFWENHLFRRDRASMSRMREEKLPIMNAIIEALPILWNQLPDEWQERCLTRLDAVDGILRRCSTDNFWADR